MQVLMHMLYLILNRESNAQTCQLSMFAIINEEATCFFCVELRWTWNRYEIPPPQDLLYENISTIIHSNDHVYILNFSSNKNLVFVPKTFELCIVFLIPTHWPYHYSLTQLSLFFLTVYSRREKHTQKKVNFDNFNFLWANVLLNLWILAIEKREQICCFSIEIF